VRGLRWLDLSVVIAYMIALALVGVRLSRRQTSTEAYFVAKRSIPAWAVGMSMLATIISAVTFIAYPGSAYAADWSLLVPGVMVVVVLALVGLLIIPFYRRVVGMSAYEYFGNRFGYGARAYSSFAFAAGHFSKMAFVLYLVSLTIGSMTGWNTEPIIVVVGLVTVFYTLIGGLEAVIWADVIQGFILWAGILVCIGYLLFLPPGGAVAAITVAAQNGKFSLGSNAMDFSRPTVIVLALYGFFWYLQKYTADQSLVQRYLAAKSERGALKGVALGAVLCIPAWALFMLIGTLLWSFYRLTGETLPAYIVKADQVFPYFITTHLPNGLAGLFIASLFGAAMATLSSDLNCLSLVAVEDFFRKLRPNSTDRQRLVMAKLMVGVCGAVAVLFAIQLAQTRGTALGLWYTISAIVAGGLAGLFLLAFFCDRASKRGAWVGIVASLVFTTWGTLTVNHGKIVDLGIYNFPFHDYLIGVTGHVVLLVVGYGASLLLPDTGKSLRHLTMWGWLERAKLQERPIVQPESIGAGRQ
jgi:solute:Na+ symporter, SSS family